MTQKQYVIPRKKKKLLRMNNVIFLKLLCGSNFALPRHDVIVGFYTPFSFASNFRAQPQRVF